MSTEISDLLERAVPAVTGPVAEFLDTRGAFGTAVPVGARESRFGRLPARTGRQPG